MDFPARVVQPRLPYRVGMPRMNGARACIYPMGDPGSRFEVSVTVGRTKQRLLVPAHACIHASREKSKDSPAIVATAPQALGRAIGA